MNASVDGRSARWAEHNAERRRSLVESALPHLADPSPLVRAMAVWALGRLDAERGKQLAIARLSDENDPQVRAEWHALMLQTEDAA